jgi:hypothetical protein
LNVLHLENQVGMQMPFTAVLPKLLHKCLSLQSNCFSPFFYFTYLQVLPNLLEIGADKSHHVI